MAHIRGKTEFSNPTTTEFYFSFYRTSNLGHSCMLALLAIKMHEEVTKIPVTALYGS